MENAASRWLEEAHQHQEASPVGQGGYPHPSRGTGCNHILRLYPATTSAAAGARFLHRLPDAAGSWIPPALPAHATHTHALNQPDVSSFIPGLSQPLTTFPQAPDDECRARIRDLWQEQMQPSTSSPGRPSPHPPSLPPSLWPLPLGAFNAQLIKCKHPSNCPFTPLRPARQM